MISHREIKNLERSRFEPSSVTGICFHTKLSILLFLTDLYYCQNDLSDNEFENFCGMFIKDISLKKLNVDEPTVGRIFMVLELPPINRQNKFEVLRQDITHVTEQYSLEGNC